MEFATPRTPKGMAEDLDRAVFRMMAASAEVLRRVDEHDEPKLWRRDGATSMTSWLAGRYDLAWGTAREWVRVARALRSLPKIAQAHARGALSWDQLRPLTRFATSETDELWARKASSMRPGALWREARRHERQSIREAQEEHRRRYLSLSWDPERPVLWLDGMLPAEQGATLESVLEQTAQKLPGDPEALDPGGARLADALVARAQGNEPQPATVVVHAGAEALTGPEPQAGPWLAETDGGARLAAETVRRLACDGRIEWVLESGGRPVGIGRRGRQVSGSLLRVLRHRDRGRCRFPGCERRRWLHSHHLVHWAQGGGTNLDNVVLLCQAHHRLLHEGGWRTSGHPGRDLRFHDPTGRALRPKSPPGVARDHRSGLRVTSPDLL